MNTGFFPTEAISSPVIQRLGLRLDCGLSCKLDKGCRSPKMPVTGKGRLKILILAEAPGEQEDARNTQLIGPAGQVLRDSLAEFGIDLDRDCRKTNAVRCRPPGNRRPTGQEIATCVPHVWEEIKAHPPRLIIPLGQVAVESFLLGRTAKTPSSIGAWRGFCIPDQKAGCWVCPTFHPSYILRSQQGRAIRGKASREKSVEEFTFKTDLERALNHLRTPFPSIPLQEWTGDKVRVKKGTTIAFDYETTGLRPWEKGQRILSVGISDGKWAGAVPLTREFAREWKQVLVDPSIRKIAHNMKFEHQWSAHCLGVEVRGWVWDTMLAAHVIDNRPGITSLKTAAYLALGVDDWGGEVRSSLKDLGMAGVTPALLEYNMKDAYYTFLLYERQRGLIK